MGIGTIILISSITAITSNIIAELIKYYCEKSSCELKIKKDAESSSSDSSENS